MCCRNIQNGVRERTVHALREQHVFGGGGFDKRVGVPGVSGERDFRCRERGPGVLLLQARVRAFGGKTLMPGVHARDVQQPAGAAGVLELHHWDVLAEL